MASDGAPEREGWQRAALGWAAAYGLAFREPERLFAALTHDSAGPGGNERLEFLGDAVLALVVAETLLEREPDWDEGALTRARAAVVCTSTLAERARALGLADRLRLGRGLRAEALPDTVLAGAFEAVVGALHLDRGLEAAHRFVLSALEPALERVRRHGGKRSWKSLLQLVCHRDLETEPVYRLERRRGPDHAPEFDVAVEIAGRRYGAGSAGSRKEAEQRAAEATLRILLGPAFDAVARGAEPRLEGPPARGAG